MTRSLLPLTEKTITSRFSAWIDMVKRKESGSILNLSNREQLWRIDEFLRHSIIRPLTYIQFLPVNLASLPIEEAEEFETYLSKQTDPKKKSIVLLIFGADRLLDEKQYLLSYLNSLPHRNTNYSILFFFQKNITLSYHLKRLSSFSTLYQNSILYSLYEKPDQEQFVSYLQRKFEFQLPNSIKNKIIEQCGGHLWLLKEAVRYYAKTTDESKLFNHDEMQLRLQIIFNEFDEVEKSVLEKLIQKKTVFLKEEGQIIDYLTKTNWLKVPILEKYIKEQLFHKNKISLNETQQITINSVLVENIFSRHERIVLKYFLKNQNQTIGRQKIASIVWGQHYTDNYTDWALDQFIKRLRNKFISLGVDQNIIKTIKNQGFIFLSSL